MNDITRQHYPGAHTYVAAWKHVKRIAAEYPEAKITVAPDWYPLPARTLQRKFTDALHARINQRGGLTAYRGKVKHPAPGSMTGRKWDTDYQAQMQRNCDNIRRHTTQRLIVHQIDTPELRTRFASIIWTDS